MCAVHSIIATHQERRYAKYIRHRIVEEFSYAKCLVHSIIGKFMSFAMRSVLYIVSLELIREFVMRFVPFIVSPELIRHWVMRRISFIVPLKKVVMRSASFIAPLEKLICLSLLQRWLRMPIFDYELFCPICDDVMDIYADHALKCPFGGDRAKRQLTEQSDGSFLPKLRLAARGR